MLNRRPSKNVTKAESSISFPTYSTIRSRSATVRSELANYDTLSNFCAGVFVSTIFVGAFTFGVGFDAGIQSFWDNWNKGVSLVVSLPFSHPLTSSYQRQWKDIRAKYIESDDS